LFSRDIFLTNVQNIDPTVIFSAKVNKIYPKMDPRSQTFKVEADFITGPETIYPGITGEANIIIAQKAKTLSIPYEYLTDGNKVLTPRGLIEVKTGLKNFERIEILSGIDENTEILKPE